MKAFERQEWEKIGAVELTLKWQKQLFRKEKLNQMRGNEWKKEEESSITHNLLFIIIIISRSIQIRATEHSKRNELIAWFLHQMDEDGCDRILGCWRMMMMMMVLMLMTMMMRMMIIRNSLEVTNNKQWKWWNETITRRKSGYKTTGKMENWKWIWKIQENTLRYIKTHRCNLKLMQKQSIKREEKNAIIKTLWTALNLTL